MPYWMQCLIDNREKAIQLSQEYKRLEKRITFASKGEQNRIRARIAQIAYDMYDLGYPLGRLIKRRQKHGDKKS
jgi:hypothetical protein